MAAATLTLLVLTLTGQTVELRSDKPSVSAGDSARIELSANDGSGQPLRDIQVSLTVNTGAVSEALLAEDGTFRATYRPAEQEGPQVALFHATVKRGASSSQAWLALPVHGPYLLPVQAPPRSRVRVVVGPTSFGPVTATTSGEASVPVKIPPGVTSAQVTITERSGRARTQTVSLPAPQFARVRLVALEPPVQGKPVRLQGFVVDESGNPAVAVPSLAISVDRGTLGPIEPKEGGTFELPYTAPAPSGAPVTVSAAPIEETERAFTLPLEPLPAPVASVEGSGPGNGRTPGSAAGPLASAAAWVPWQRTAGIFLFGQSNTADANGLGLRLEGSVRLDQRPWEALVLVELKKNGEVMEKRTSSSGSAVTKTFTLSSLGLRAGGRWSHPLLTRGLLFADAGVGVLATGGEVVLQSGEEKLKQQLSSVGPALSLGGGVAWSVGPGRLCGQLDWAYSPGRNRVSGNLGGLSLAAGYQFVFGGGRQP
jgi:hypothetical protein